MPDRKGFAWLLTIAVFVLVFFVLYVFVFQGKISRDSLSDIPATIERAPVTQEILSGTSNVVRNFQKVSEDAGERLYGENQ